MVGMKKVSNGVCITKKEGEVCLCPLNGVINIIGRKWNLLIISVIGNHDKIRFNELMKTLEGISSKSLADKLKELEAEGLIKREMFAEIPPRVEYSLTEDGLELRNAIMPLMKWSSKKRSSRNLGA